MVAVKGLYILAAVMLALYGIQALVLCYLSLRHRRDVLSCPELDDWPSVTIQLPTYNEYFVAERLLRAVTRMVYPREKLQIQVLDDSTDDTTQLLEREVGRCRAAGLTIELLHRVDRVGFKAGALKEGLEKASGEVICIFDADFVPPADFLLRTVPYLMADPQLALVQARWGHLNAKCSTLTRAQALALDTHFMIEQFGRQRGGLFMPFNGTAGIWRREAIEAAGGWQSDTLCEDLDLSYRAQTAGWRCLFLPEVEAPAELPPQMAALKRQQARWAQGSIQCLLKLCRPVLGARVALSKRLMGLAHLCSYGMHPFVLVILLCALPLLAREGQIRVPILTYLGVAGFGPPLAQILGQRALHRDWPRRLLYLPFLLMLGTGLSWQNTVAVFKALTGQKTAFLRTPKFELTPDARAWRVNRYALGLDLSNAGELMLMAYSGLTILVAIAQGSYLTIPFLLMYFCGFAYVGLYDVWQNWRLATRRPQDGRLSPQAF